MNLHTQTISLVKISATVEIIEFLYLRFLLQLQKTAKIFACTVENARNGERGSSRDDSETKIIKTFFIERMSIWIRVTTPVNRVRDGSRQTRRSGSTECGN